MGKDNIRGRSQIWRCVTSVILIKNTHFRYFCSFWELFLAILASREEGHNFWAWRHLCMTPKFIKMDWKTYTCVPTTFKPVFMVKIQGNWKWRHKNGQSTPLNQQIFDPTSHQPLILCYGMRNFTKINEDDKAVRVVLSSGDILLSVPWRNFRQKMRLNIVQGRVIVGSRVKGDCWSGDNSPVFIVF